MYALPADSSRAAWQKWHSLKQCGVQRAHKYRPWQGIAKESGILTPLSGTQLEKSAEHLSPVGRLVGLEGAKDGFTEDVRGAEPHCAQAQIHAHDQDGHVGQVDEHRYGARKCAEAAEQETQRIQRDVDSHRASSVERLPPAVLHV